MADSISNNYKVLSTEYKYDEYNTVSIHENLIFKLDILYIVRVTWFDIVVSLG